MDNDGCDVIQVSRKVPKVDPFKNFFDRSLLLYEDIVDATLNQFWMRAEIPGTEGVTQQMQDNVVKLKQNSMAAQAKFWVKFIVL